MPYMQLLQNNQFSKERVGYMKTSKKKLAAILVVLLTLSTMVVSCMSIGRPFPKESVRAITIGTTTREDVRKMFGKPYRTGLEDGQETWTYFYGKKQILEKSEATDLVVRFEDNGTVRSYSFSTTPEGN